jgi:hypothetical protein
MLKSMHRGLSSTFSFTYPKSEYCFIKIAFDIQNFTSLLELEVVSSLTYPKQLKPIEVLVKEIT